MPPTNDTDSTGSTEEVNVIEDVSELVERSPLVQIFGDHAKARMIDVLLATHPQPLNPTEIVDRAGLGSRQSFYDYRDDLLESGFVEQRGAAGNSPLYGLPEDDERVALLQEFYDRSAAYLREKNE